MRRCTLWNTCCRWLIVSLPTIAIAKRAVRLLYFFVGFCVIECGPDDPPKRRLPNQSRSKKACQGVARVPTG